VAFSQPGGFEQELANAIFRPGAQQRQQRHKLRQPPKRRLVAAVAQRFQQPGVQHLLRLEHGQLAFGDRLFGLEALQRQLGEQRADRRRLLAR